MEKQTFVKGAAILGIAGLIVKIIGAVYRIPLTNIIGLEGMSYYEVAYPYYTTLLTISSAGLPTAISKLVAERATLGDMRGAKRVFSTSMLLLIAIGLCTSLIMYFAAPWLAAKSQLTDAVMSLRALSPALLIVSVMCAYRGYLQGMQLMTGTAISQLMEQLGKLAIGFTLASQLLEKGPAYAAMGALIGVSISELLALAIIYWFYLRKRKEFTSRRTDKKFKQLGFTQLAKDLMAVAIPVTIGACIMPLTNIVDVNMIMKLMIKHGFSFETAQTAFAVLRSNVTPLINMPAILSMALAMSLVPAISAALAKRELNVAKAASRTGIKLALIIGLPCATGLFVLAKPIIGMLYTTLTEPQLMLAADLMRTASVGVVFLSLVQTLTGVLQGMGRPKVPVFNLFIGGLLKVLTMVMLMNIPSVNIQGAAVSTVACYAAAGILNLIYVIRKAGLKVNPFEMFIKPVAASLAMGLIVHFIYDLLSGIHKGALSTLAAVLVGGAVYVGLMFVFKLLSPEDLSFIPGGRRLKKLMYREERR